MPKPIPGKCGPNRMRSCRLAESTTEKSAASDITLVFLSRSSVLITQITHLGHVLTSPQIYGSLNGLMFRRVWTDSDSATTVCAC